MVDFPALLRRFAQAVVANDGEALKAAHGYAPAFYDDGFKFGKFIGNETEKWGKVIRAAHLKVE